MIIIPITDRNGDLLVALGEGLNPPPDINDWGGENYQYLVIESGKPPRIMQKTEWQTLMDAGAMKTTMRKFHYIAK